MRRSNNVRFSQIAVIGFILSILGSAMPQTSHADLVDDGKQMLLEENDLYGAAAKFDEALAASPSDGRANFWQALTLIWTNPDLKGTFLDLEVFGENDTDPESDLLILDEVDHEKYQPTGIDAIILDNSDSGYTEPGTGWYDPDPTVESSYRENCRVHSAGTGTNTAAWEMAVPVDGYYNVHVWVANIGNNTQNQHYSVTHDTGTSTVDKWWGTYDSWKTLGRFKFTTGQPARIELSDLTYSTGSIVADAVKLEYDGDEFDDMLAGATGTWVSYGNTNAIGGTYREIAYGNTGTLTWAPYIPNDGKYQIYAFYQSAGDSATNASYSITPAGGTATTIVVDQQREGFTRVSLGLFDLKAGMGNTIVLSSSGANGKVTADAIRIVPMRTFPTAAQIQGNLTSTITQINTALSCLDAIGTGFADTVDLGMKDASGNPMMTELDYGDVLMFKATMNMIKHNFNLIGAYDFSTIDPNQVACSYNIIINDVFDYYTSLATLRPDGASCLADAKSAFQESIEQYFNAYDVIINESDDQTADLIVFDQGYIERDVDALHPLLTDILNNLNGNIPSVQFDTDQLFEQLEMDDTYQAFNINLRSLYDDPKQLRDLRPQFDDENHIIRSSFPDPTFDGLLPDMTEEELNGILHKGPELEHIDIIWNGDVPNVDLSWTTDTYDDFTRYALFRAEDGNVTESSIKVYESTNKNITTCTDTTLNPDQRTYYYRLYTYYSNGDKSATNVRKAVTSVYVNISATGTEDGSKEDPYNTLNEAVDAAVNGAKIRVAAGAYPCSDRELGMWDKGNLKFEGGYEPVHWTRDYEANETILDGTGQDGWSTISFNRATGGGIDGFTVTGAFMSDGACGIQISQATDVIIRNCKIISNRRGIGVWDHSSCVIENCSIENNVTDGIGTDASSAVIRETAIAHNQQSAINAYSYSSIDISDSQIFDNCVTGGTIYFIVHIGNHSNLNVTRTSVYQNNNTGAGLAVRDYGTFSIRDSQIYNNGGRAVEIYMASGDLTNTLVANNALDGISLTTADSIGAVTINNCTVVGNCTTNQYACGILCSTSGGTFTPQIKNTIVANNLGYGIFAWPDCVPLVAYTDIYNNTSGNSYSSGYTDGGGNIALDPLFVTGPSGNYYLSQVASGQPSNSPCVDIGSATSASLGLDALFTRSDEIGDSGIVDMGYHYALNITAIIKDVTPTNYTVAENLAAGSQYYGDRTYTLTSVPSELSVASWIRTRNADKSNTLATFLTFTLTQDGMVYVAYDTRATSLPTWMSGFTNTGLTLGTTDVTLKVYAKMYPAGTVILGGNMATGAVGAATNYLVAAKEGDSLALIKYVTPTNCTVAENLAVGSQYYGDRTYTLTSVPADLSAATWIKTRNADKNNTSASFLTFTLTQDGMVYVAYDSRATSLPTWLNGFTNTGLTLGTTDVTLKVYAKMYPAGTVTLGGNMASGAAGAGTNYVVAAKESESLALIKYVTPTNYTVVENLAAGSQYYGDRTYTLTSVPSELSVASWIRTRNADKSNTLATFLTFTLTQDGMVYVAYDSRATSLPTWMSGFTNTGLTLGTTDVTLKVYAKMYPAGTVILGGNMATGAVGAATNYLVAAKEGDSLALIKYVTPTNYTVAENLAIGSEYYGDRTYTLTSLPAELNAGSWIKTRNSDKTNTSAEFIKFTLTRNAMVYVAYDSRASSLPAWMSGYTNTGLTLGTTDVTLKVYAKFYSAGQVTLGGNMATGAVGAATNYVVVAKEQ